MIRNGTREPLPVVLTPPEMRADAWHLAGVEQGRCDARPDRCWCCCRTCRESNPHYRAGWRAKFADLRERVNLLYDGSRPEHVPRPNDWRKKGRRRDDQD